MESQKINLATRNTLYKQSSTLLHSSVAFFICIQSNCVWILHCILQSILDDLLSISFHSNI